MCTRRRATNAEDSPTPRPAWPYETRHRPQERYLSAATDAHKPSSHFGPAPIEPITKLRGTAGWLAVLPTWLAPGGTDEDLVAQRDAFGADMHSRPRHQR